MKRNIFTLTVNEKKTVYITACDDLNELSYYFAHYYPTRSECSKHGMVREASFRIGYDRYHLALVSESAARDSASYFKDRPDLMAEINNAQPLTVQYLLSISDPLSFDDEEQLYLTDRADLGSLCKELLGESVSPLDIRHDGGHREAACAGKLVTLDMLNSPYYIDKAKAARPLPTKEA